MAWDFPPGSDVDIQSWLFQRQYWRAGRERAIVCGLSDEGRWPQGNVVWFRGTITAVTATSIEVSGAGWSTAPKRWVAWTSPPGTNQPADYDVYVDDPAQLDDPTHVVRATISDHTADTLTVSDMTEWVTSRTITVLNDLVGRKCNIFERGGLIWSDRWPDAPNSQEFAEGTVDSATAGLIVPVHALWRPGELVGRDVMFRNGSDVLQRGRITDDADGQLVFTGTTGTAAGAWHVVDADGFYQWGRVPWGHRSFYSGADEGYYTRLPDESIGQHNKPAPFVHYLTGDGITCDDVSIAAKDKDVWSPPEELCSEADHCYTPNYWKSYRALQQFIEDVAHLFVDPTIEYDGSVHIRQFTPATLYEAAAINAERATAGGWAVGELTVSLTQPWDPIDLVYTVLYPDDSGDVAEFAPGVYSGGILGVSGGLDASYAAATVIVSRRGTRRVPCQIQRMFPKTVWIPDMDPDADPPAVIDPPAEPDLPGGEGPGDWVTRAASTHLLMASDAGSLGFIGESANAWDALAAGMYVRLVGDNWCDPSIFPNDNGSPMDPKTPYYNRFYVGQHPPDVQAGIYTALYGVATGGSNVRIEDATKDWYQVNATDDAGALKTHAFTATGGSTTSASFATASDFFDTTLGNTGGRFVGFVIEVETVGGSGIYEARPITAHAYSAGTATLTWSEATSATASGKACRIVEPAFELDRYQGRTVQVLRKATGTIHLTSIQHVGRRQLFIADIGFALVAGDEYRITDPITGTVWLYDGSGYSRPSGLDPRSLVGDADFLFDPTANAETIVQRYGFINLCDDVDTVPGPLQELYDCFNLLTKTRHGFSWIDGHSQSATGGSEEEWGFDGFDWDDAIADLNASWAGGSPGASIDTPYALSTGKKNLTEGLGMEAFSDRRDAFAQALLPSDVLAAQVYFYAFSESELDRDDGGFCEPDDLGGGDIRHVWHEYLWDAQGDDVKHRQFSLFSTDAVAFATTRTSPDALGQMTAPALPDEPSPGGCFTPTTDAGLTDDYRELSWKGYLIQRSRGDHVAWWAVADWKVAGGMKYAD